MTPLRRDLLMPAPAGGGACLAAGGFREIGAYRRRAAVQHLYIVAIAFNPRLVPRPGRCAVANSALSGHKTRGRDA